MADRKHGQSLRVSQEAVKAWREYEDTLKKLEQDMDREPALFASRTLKYVAFVSREYQKYWRYLRNRFGVEYCVSDFRVKHRHRRSEVRVVDPRRAPQTRQDKFLHEAARYQLIMLELLLRGVFSAADEAERADPDVDREICKAFLWWFRSVPTIYGVKMLDAEHPDVQQGATLALSAWLRTQIQQGYLQSALDDEGTGLLEALPPAVFVGFADMEPNESLRPRGEREKSLVSRVSGYIQKLGREARVHPKLALGKLPDEANVGNETERELAMFAWIEELFATLAPREREVMYWHLLEETESEIAERLGVSKNTIKTMKRRAREKLTKQRQSAGL